MPTILNLCMSVCNKVVKRRDVPTGGMGASCSPTVFKFARKLVKRQPCCKRVDNSIFCDLLCFLETIVCQLVNGPPPIGGVLA